jgi:deoxycytidine triphosphate deaminase
MKLSAIKVLELNEKYNLIEGLSEICLNNPEGVDLELRVGSVEKILGPSFLGVTDRSSAKTEIIGDIEKDGNKRIALHSGDCFLVKTMEKINCPGEKIVYDKNKKPSYIIPDIKPRVSLQKAGVSLLCSTTNPGYSGPLVFGISNNSNYDFEFELGARMFKILWEPVIGDIKRVYSGQHQGGRTTSQGDLEKQV